MTSKQAVDKAFQKLRRKLNLPAIPLSKYCSKHQIETSLQWPQLMGPPFHRIKNFVSRFCAKKKSKKDVLYSKPSKGMTDSNATSILTQISKEPGWIIKSADKRSVVVLCGRDSYVKEAGKQLSDKQFYEPADNAYSDVLVREFISFNEASFKRGARDETTKNFLMPTLPTRTPLFYLLPKIHKKGVPGRPVVSGCDAPTENMSRYIDFFLQPLVSKIPSYVRDTKHFLQTILGTKQRYPKGTLLITLDVKRLYTNIPHHEGIEACCNAFQHTTVSPKPPLWFFRKCLEYILKRNYFKRGDSCDKQIMITAKGCRCAACLANIFLDQLERQMLHSAPNNLRPLLWKHFIDQIFLIWVHGRTKFQIFLKYLSSFHPTVKF